MKKINKGFTLVELIVVITILAILGTIAFLSLQGYSQNARDGVRTSDIKNIEKGLGVMLVKSGIVPTPDDTKINIMASGTLIGIQGYAGKLVQSQIGMSKESGKDPLDGTYYTYLTNASKTNYQIMGFLEGSVSETILGKSYALDYTNRNPVTKGGELGILLSNTGSDINRPLQEFYNAGSFTGVDVVSYSGTIGNNSFGDLKVAFNNNSNDNIIGTGSSLSRLENIYKGVYQIVMTTCPSGWSDLGLLGGTISSGLGTTPVTFKINGTNQNYKVCEGNSFTSSNQVIMLSCPNGWSDLGLLGGTIPSGLGTTPVTFKINGTNQNYKVCEGNNFTSSNQVIMSSCPNGWSDLGLLGGTVPAGLGTSPVTFKKNGATQNYKVCEKK